jgi:RNA polymerase sigma-B factor
VGPSSSLFDERSRERLIEAHLPLVKSIARRYAGRGEDLDDLMQLGAVGLIKASKRFDPGRGVTFGTFATPAIEGEIRRHLRDRPHPLRIPRGVERMGSELRRCDSELSARLGRSPTVPELATALGVEERDVERALDAAHARDSVPLTEGRDPGLGARSEALDESEDRVLLAGSLRALDKRERRIVFLRFHADLTERQIAHEIGISQAHVSRLLAGALEKLRDELGGSREGTDGDTTPVISLANAPTDPRIRAVGQSPEKPTVEHYLDLPYHVEVVSEQVGERLSWKATVEELPGCTSRGETADEAVARLRPEMRTWLAAAIAEHREIPVPGREASTSRTTRGHSGRFLVRMPTSLHEQLSAAAEREHVSLNRFVTDALAASVGYSRPANAPSDPEPSAGDSAQAPVGVQAPARAFRLALATNLVVVVIVALIAITLLVLALERGI